MIKIQLKGCVEVKVDAFEFGYTYANLIEGSPNEMFNEKTFDKASYPPNWGIRKVLKIKPDREEFENKLQPCRYAVWLYSDEPINPNYSGSELVVIWFGELPYGKTFIDLIQSGIGEIDWIENAQDFNF